MSQSQAVSQTKYRRLSGSTLKLLAMLSMLIDHTACAILYHAILLPNAPIQLGSPLHKLYLFYKVLRGIGRIAFPIFCFLLVQGFLHTSSRKRYLLRLGIFALLSELPFDLALKDHLFDWGYQNVFFTLLIGFAVLCLMERFADSPCLQAVSVAAGMLLAWLLRTDYSYHGILLIAILYFFRLFPGLMTVAGCLSLLWEAPACFAFIPINLYNGKRGLTLKYFFYLFYPLHLFLLWLIRTALW